MKSTQSLAALCLLLFSAALEAQPPAANVTVEAAWVRSPLQSQRATAAFMQLTARSNTRLVGASTPAAKVTEIHEMKMEGDVMKMRAIDSLELPAGRAVSLRPGGYHLMLQDLQTTLAPGSKMALTLIFRDSKGAQSQMQLELPVQSAPMGHAASHAPGSVPSSAHKH